MQRLSEVDFGFPACWGGPCPLGGLPFTTRDLVESQTRIALIAVRAALGQGSVCITRNTEVTQKCPYCRQSSLAFNERNELAYRIEPALDPACRGLAFEIGGVLALHNNSPRVGSRLKSGRPPHRNIFR